LLSVFFPTARVNLLDRHIFKSVLFTCTGAVALFAFVLMLGNLIRDLLPYLLSGQLPTGTFLRLVWMLVPAVAIYAPADGDAHRSPPHARSPLRRQRDHRHARRRP
jgi:hypothetical protein